MEILKSTAKYIVKKITNFKAKETDRSMDSIYTSGSHDYKGLLDQNKEECGVCFNDFERNETTMYSFRTFKSNGYFERDVYMCSTCVMIKCDCGSRIVPTNILYCHDTRLKLCINCFSKCEACETMSCNSCTIDFEGTLLCSECFMSIEK